MKRYDGVSYWRGCVLTIAVSTGVSLLMGAVKAAGTGLALPDALKYALGNDWDTWLVNAVAVWAVFYFMRGKFTKAPSDPPEKS